MTLNYKSFGQGFPIIILHGLFGMLDNWQTIAKRLAENYTVYIIDQRNHGRSPHLPNFNYQLLAEDLQQFMEEQWIYEAHVIGHSMGGKTAMQFALNYPDMVSKLVVVDMAPKSYQAGHQAIFDALLSVDLATTTSRKEATSQLSQTIKETSTLQFLLKNLTRNKEGKYEWKMNLPVLHQRYHRILENIEIEGPPFEKPTLFVRGGTSSYILDSDKEIIQDFFSSVSIATIPSANHWVHASAPEEFLEMVLTFLNR